MVKKENNDDDFIEFDLSKIFSFFKKDKKSKKQLKKKEKKEEIIKEEIDDEDFDFKSVKNFVNNHKWIYSIIGIITVLIFAQIVRTQNVKWLNGDTPLALDPFVFLRYAKAIVNGGLPLNDTLRYYPKGFDTSKELLVPSYGVAFLYNLVSIFSSSTVDQVALYYPVIMTLISLVFFYLFVKELFNDKTAFFSSMFLSVVMGFIYRTSYGFIEKEPTAIVFLFAMIYFVFKALKSKTILLKIIFGIFGGIGVLGSFLSWGGSNFLLLPLAVSLLLAVLMNKTKRKDSILFLIFALFLMLIPLFTERYGDFLSVLFDYKVILFILTLYFSLYKFEIYPLIEKTGIFSFKPENGNENVFILLTGASILIIISLIYPGYSLYLKYINFIYITILLPMGGDAFATSVSESQNAYLNSFISSLNENTLYLMFVGVFFLIYNSFKKITKKNKLIFSLLFISLIISLLLTNYNTNSNDSITKFFNFMNWPYLFLVGFLVYSVYFFIKYFNKLKNIDIEIIFLLVWLLLSIIGSLGGIRIIFILCPVAMIFVGYLFNILLNWAQKIQYVNIKYIVFGIILLLFIIMFKNMYVGAKQANYYMGPSFTYEWREAMDWVQNNTELDSVFTHWWDYGYWIQTMGNRTTTLDGGNFDPSLNHLTGRYLFASQIYQNDKFNMTEPATTLVKDFGSPNYFLIVDDDVLKYVQMGRIGKRPTFYVPGTYSETLDNNDYNIGNVSEYPQLIVFNSIYGYYPIQEEFTYGGYLFTAGDPVNSRINQIIYLYNPDTKEFSDQVYASVYNNFMPNKAAVIPFNGYCNVKEKCYTLRNDSIKEYPLLFPADFNMNMGVILITEKASNNLFTYLYLLETKVPGFNLVYDNDRPLTIQGMQSQGYTDIKIYKINYTELNPFVLNKSLKNYWNVEGDVFW